MSDFNEVIEALYIGLWFCQSRENGMPASFRAHFAGNGFEILRRFKKEGEPKFVASVGWLDRWKKRYGVRQLSVSGEKLSGDIQSVLDFRSKFQKLVEDEGTSGDAIHNCDETGSNFKLLPAKSLTSKH